MRKYTVYDSRSAVWKTTAHQELRSENLKTARGSEKRHSVKHTR